MSKGTVQPSRLKVLNPPDVLLIFLGFIILLSSPPTTSTKRHTSENLTVSHSSGPEKRLIQVLQRSPEGGRPPRMQWVSSGTLIATAGVSGGGRAEKGRVCCKSFQLPSLWPGGLQEGLRDWTDLDSTPALLVT